MKLLQAAMASAREMNILEKALNSRPVRDDKRKSRGQGCMKEFAMPTTSQFWFLTKKTALVIGVLAVAHVVAAPRMCPGCEGQSGKSQAATNPALGGPDTKSIGDPGLKSKRAKKKAKTTTSANPPDGGLAAKGFNPQPDPPGILGSGPLGTGSPAVSSPGTAGRAGARTR
jgi:hypothetical protein